MKDESTVGEKLTYTEDAILGLSQANHSLFCVLTVQLDNEWGALDTATVEFSLHVSSSSTKKMVSIIYSNNKTKT